MVCVPSPFPKAVLAEASRIAPARRTTSDGICGDAAHQATQSDHNPDARGIPHAVDISHDPPRFDAMAYGLKIAARHDPRVTYLVGNWGGPDMIWHPEVSDSWRQNGGYKTEHRSHLHVSFSVAAEQSTAPFFEVGDEPVTDAEIQKIVDKIGKIDPNSGLASGVLPVMLKRYLNDPVYLGHVADEVVRKLGK